MAESFFDRVHKQDTHTPDVLACLANLSNDEVFTPPEIVNQMLDMLPQELFESTETTFLDPACKTGVFLREIAKRLLEHQVPLYQEKMQLINKKKNLKIALTVEDEIFLEEFQKTIDHIFHKQLYGIAITELTSLLSRRSLYCSKYPNGQYSITHFDNAEGNIRFRRIKHKWKEGKCQYCGVSQIGEFNDEKREELDTHAYEFIHITEPKEIYGMKFDVIISNPPYQLASTKEAKYAKAIYNSFVTQAMKMNPRFITMIIPSRWFSGGLGLDEFRNLMLHDDRIMEINDFPDASDCFPGVEIKGGVNYFLWNKDHHGICHVVTHKSGKIVSDSFRPLLEDGMETFVRNNEILTILHKVEAFKEKSFSSIVGSYDPFGFDVREKNSFKRVRIPFSNKQEPGSVRLYYNGWRKDGIGYVKKELINKGNEMIDSIKVLIPKAWGIGDVSKDWVHPFKVEENTCCTETYLVVGPFASAEEAENCISYTQTRFFHLLVSLIKITQNTMQGAYSKVPMQDWSRKWTDEDLFKKYDLSQDEIQFINNTVKPDGEILNGGEE